jgi:prophage regulatory protein
MSQTIQRLRTVLHVRGRSRSSHYLDIQQGLFTPPVQIGPRAVGWPSSEVEALNAARIAGKSDQEVRALVKNLAAARKSAS